MTRALATVLLCLFLTAPVVEAQALTLSGYLNNPGNPALVGSDLGTPLFSNDFEIANNVAVYVFSMPAAGAVQFVSSGAAAGGIDPYFTLFQGSGNSATFLASNYTQAFTTGGDFNLSLTLAPGDYTVVISAFANMSIAENNGTGSLGDGFVGLGQPDNLGNCYYEVGIASPGIVLPGDEKLTPVPTLNDWGMILLGILLFSMAVRTIRKREDPSLH
jgi:hypothetical protein